ncbi:hypothetical protein H4R35_002593 [Dimargaris xerosporica]|nr:hypothetical protein H4R35_002593 [Dimargaris xerosporica]
MALCTNFTIDIDTLVPTESGLQVDQPGDTVVSTSLPWAKRITVDLRPGSPHAQSLSKAPSELADLPPHWHLSILGMSGFTAWYGLTKIGQPKEGETLVVSAASGTVGQTVIELAKAYGLRVVASAGIDDKCQFLSKELGVDEAFNYRTIDSYEDTLKRLCLNGIDMHFDNVDGGYLDGVLVNINTHARIIICGGLASQYEPDKANH